MSYWVEIFASQCLRDCLNLITELSRSVFELPPFLDGVRDDVSVRESVADLDVAYIQVSKH